MMLVNIESASHIKAIRELYGANIQAKLAGEYYKILTNSSNQHREVTSYFESNEVDSFIIRPIEEKPIRAVLKGIPTIMDIATIKAELGELGFMAS